MTDIKTALSRLNIPTNPAESAEEVTQTNDERGLSSYEEFLRANKYLKREKEMPLKQRDLAKILRLEKLLQHFQAKLQEEVTAYRSVFPDITHDELSQRALDLRIEKQRRDQEELLERQKDGKKLINGN